MDAQPNADEPTVEVVSRGSVRVTGELDVVAAPALAEVLDNETGDVDLDMSAVEFIDSSGLRVLVRAHQSCEARGSTLTIRHPSTQVRRLVELSALDDYLNVD